MSSKGGGWGRRRPRGPGSADEWTVGALRGRQASTRRGPTWIRPLLAVQSRTVRCPMGMSLNDGRTATRLPAQELERARRFYSDKLGLEPVDERPGGLLYRPAGGGEFALFA